MSDLLLDVGCGDGSTAIERGWNREYRYLGLDNDPAKVAQARERGLAVGCVDVNGGIPLPNDSVARVTAKAVLEHVVDPVGVVEECFRVLKPGGKAYAIVPTDRSYDIWGDYTHKRAFRQDAAVDLFRDAGASDVTVRPYHPIGSLGMAVRSLARILAPWTPYGFPRAWEVWAT